MKLGRPSEPELQEWIIQSMENRGFVCHNLHERERSHEEGVDIECVIKGEKEVIQAKIRPRKEDISQLRKFATTGATRRTYVYWDKPTKAFEAELGKQPSVQVLAGQELHASLLKNMSSGYLIFLLTETKLLSEIIISLLDIYDCQTKQSRKFAADDFPYLWGLKSSVVQVKANLRMILLEAEKRLLSRTSHDVSVEIVNEMFERLSLAESEAESLRWAVERCKREAPHILNAYLFRITHLSGGGELDAEVSRFSRSERRLPVRDWLIDPISTRGFTSVYTWLYHAIDHIYDRLNLLSIAIDVVFQDAMSQVLHRNITEHFD
ncbi:MAG: hypothetical protein JRN62_01075 [Nitrososphaerota archaeon]|nr:hypothetical protein [Nitrososphaerota archaeon]